MKWDVKIARTQNGYLLEAKNDEDKLVQYVFEDEEDNAAEPFVNDGNAVSFAALLWMLHEVIGPTTSRYASKRVYTIIRPGDKNEAFTEEHSKEIWGEEDVKKHSKAQSKKAKKECSEK